MPQCFEVFIVCLLVLELMLMKKAVYMYAYTAFFTSIIHVYVAQYRYIGLQMVQSKISNKLNHISLNNNNNIVYFIKLLDIYTFYRMQ